MLSGKALKNRYLFFFQVIKWLGSLILKVFPTKMNLCFYEKAWSVVLMHPGIASVTHSGTCTGISALQGGPLPHAGPESARIPETAPPVQGELSAMKIGLLTPFCTMGLFLRHAIHCCSSHLPASLLKQAAKPLHPIINKQRSPLVLCCVPEPSCG